MKQHSNALWNRTGSTPEFTALSGNETADVAIVGAGITGLTAAALLKERGRSVIVLEPETIGSADTAAHITAAVDARYHYLKRAYSPDDARIVAEASRASIDTIEELIRRYGIDCRFSRVPGYLYTEKRKYVAELKNEARAAQETGLEVTFTDTVPLPFLTRGAALFADQAQFHPREYLAGLASKIAGDGCRIFENTPVTGVKSGEPCAIETPTGRVTAQSVLMTTGFTPLDTFGVAYRTYLIAFESEGEHPAGLFRDTADPYHYTQWLETSEGTFMIVGGEDHRASQEHDAEECFQRLVDYAREHYGEVRERYRWSEQLLEPHGGLPLIGRKDGIYISTGYGGEAATMGTAGAMIVSDLITGVENRWAPLFAFDRERPKMTAREFRQEKLEPLPKLTNEIAGLQGG